METLSTTQKDTCETDTIKNLPYRYPRGLFLGKTMNSEYGDFSFNISLVQRNGKNESTDSKSYDPELKHFVELKIEGKGKSICLKYLCESIKRECEYEVVVNKELILGINKFWDHVKKLCLYDDHTTKVKVTLRGHCDEEHNDPKLNKFKISARSKHGNDAITLITVKIEYHGISMLIDNTNLQAFKFFKDIYSTVNLFVKSFVN